MVIEKYRSLTVFAGIAEKPVPESIAQNKEIDDLRHQMASLVNIAGALLTIVKAKQALDPTPDRDPCTSGSSLQKICSSNAWDSTYSKIFSTSVSRADCYYCYLLVLGLWNPDETSKTMRSKTGSLMSYGLQSLARSEANL